MWLYEIQKHRWRKELREPFLPDVCRFWLGWDERKKFPVVQKVIQVMIVTASGGAYVPDFGDQSLSCLGYNEVLSAVNSVRSFFVHDDVAACAFIDDKMVPACVEAAQKFKRLQDPERASPWYGVSVRSRELLLGMYVRSLRAGEGITRYPGVDEYTSRYSKGLARRKRTSVENTAAVPVASSSWPRAQDDVVIGGAVSDSGSSVLLSELRRKKRKRKVVDFFIDDC